MPKFRKIFIIPRPGGQDFFYISQFCDFLQTLFERKRIPHGKNTK